MNSDWETPFFQEPFSLDEEETHHKIYTISELTSELRTMLENTYPFLWVEGELSNCKIHQNKHLFFTMKDENSQIDAIMFSSSLQRIVFQPENGLQVIVQGRISFYPPQGKAQIIVHDMQLKGRGALFIALHQLMIKLKKEGLFDPSHKKTLPLLPERIGIITSPTGAAIKDIVKVIKQRHPNLEILIYPSRVQGDEAPGELIEGIEYFNKARNVDVIILTRGGGSIEDLWAFNDEQLARAIYNSMIPVISAVGHEIDQSISDLVADIAAPTPTAAALIVVRAKDELKEAIAHLQGKLNTAMQLKIEKYKNILIRLHKDRAFQGFSYRMEFLLQHISELTLKLSYKLSEQLGLKKERFSVADNRLNKHLIFLMVQRCKAQYQNAVTMVIKGMEQFISGKNRMVQVLNARLSVLHPFDILKRGYSICYDGEKQVIIKDAGMLKAEQEVYVKLYKGSFKSIIREVENED